jgi:uncharacterized protein (DUF1697 family)
MTRYLVLLRGINVGGKNTVGMAPLKRLLEEQLGFEEVNTHLVSGNVTLSSRLSAKTVAQRIEDKLGGAFKFDTELIRVLALSRAELKAIVDERPQGFGDAPDKYHSDAIFLMGIDAKDALGAFSPREGVDTIWPGTGVIYSQRLSVERTKSRLGRIAASPHYKSMTIRSWSTTLKLMQALNH